MYKFMDKERIEISQISNLKMIHIYDLSGIDGDTSNSIGTINSARVPALAVYYGQNKQINLCFMDKNYNYLVEKVLSLYSELREKNSIIMDERTKQFLELAFEKGESMLTTQSKRGKNYINIESLKVPRYSEEGYKRTVMMPIIQHYLTELYSLWDMKIEFFDAVSGWHGNGVIKGIKNNHDIMFPVRTAFFESGRYQVIVGNFLEERNCITFNIRYEQENFMVSFESDDYKLYGESNFSFTPQRAVCTTKVSLNGTVVYYNEEQVHKADALVVNDIIALDILEIDTSKAKIYEFPWKSYYLYSYDCKEENGGKSWSFDTTYVEKNCKTIFVRQYAWSVVENINDGVYLKVDGARIEHLIPNREKGDMQTLFLPVGYSSSCDYKQNLEGKYFINIRKDLSNGVI